MNYYREFYECFTCFFRVGEFAFFIYRQAPCCSAVREEFHA